MLNGHPLRLIANNTYPSKSWGPPGELMPDLTQFLTNVDPRGVTLSPHSVTFINVSPGDAGDYPACEAKVE